MQEETDDAKNDGDTIRSVVRALTVLKLMNERPLWMLQDIHHVSGLPKSTLSRLLATLVHEGYVRSEGPPGTYRITSKTCELGAGYSESNRLIDVGSAIALKVTRKIKWPLALGVLDCDAIVVRFSTMPYSPLAVQPTTLGHRLGLVETAMGRIYLAFCSETERDSIFRQLAGLKPGGEKLALDWMLRDIARVRAAGYAVRQPSGTRGSATLAVPLLCEGNAIAALSMTTFGRSMTRTVIERHLPILVDTARQIVDVFEKDASVSSA
ncbi:helix-turn-helix domain-containing protein [Caballeronia sp. DA-9]|uniref:helix-turn-helix domain-containing protein n=1 Tax=Caballeronia sp. DA-9 TaxID=3436237 RepID=UPI003F677BCA